MDHGDRRKGGSPEEESFREMLEGAAPEGNRPKPGERVTAKVVGITSEWIFLDLGGKGEGCIERKELEDPEGTLSVREGDAVEAYCAGTVDGEMRFTTRIGGGSVGMAQLEEAFRCGIPVEGSVEGRIKGGFEVRVGDGIRAFCPRSQMGESPEEDRGEAAGKRLLFRITELDERSRNVVLSRRALLEERRIAERESLRKTLREGMVVRGRIRSVKEFGVFVTVGPLEGLVPASETGHDRGEDLREALAAGQEVDVAVVRLDWEKDRFTFSMKRTLPDPWEGAGERYPAGSLHAGKVTRLAAFGAFVSLEAGVEGLLHISALGGGKRIRHPREAVREGEELSVKVESVDEGRRRISLSLGEEDVREDLPGQMEDHRDAPGQTPGSLGSLGEALKAKLEEKRRK